MVETLRAAELLNSGVRSDEHILLINPPVEETRYSWVRWNQPLDLLKLGRLLSVEMGCQVSLIDHMRPDSKWKVPFEFLPAARRTYELGGEQYPMRRFGRPYQDLFAWKDEHIKKRCLPQPTQIWITSLCSYWFDSVAQTSRVARDCFPGVRSVLIGNYPRLLPSHAQTRCAVDCIVVDHFDLQRQTAMHELYGNNPPPFVALQVHTASAIQELENAFRKKVLDFTFFDEDIFSDGGEGFEKILRAATRLSSKIRFHLICGVHPYRINGRVAQLLADKRVAEVHIEEAGDLDSLDTQIYQEVRICLQNAGLSLPSEKVSGFVWIGRPGEQLDRLVLKSFQALDLLGSFILKPFSPTPGSTEYLIHEEYLNTLPLRNFSPHLFPFAEINRITRQEYHDLYRMAAFLNEKVRNRAFDFLNGTLGSRLLRESLRKEVWKLEQPAPAFRIVN